MTIVDSPRDRNRRPNKAEIPREKLHRTTGFQLSDPTRKQSADTGFDIEGYATVYGRDLKAGEKPTPEAGWAQINSWEGMFWERFTRGSFKQTLRNNKVPVMQFDHGGHPTVGSVPVGVWTSMTEEADGLHAVGRLSDNWLVEPVRIAIIDGAINGMSIRFTALRDTWETADGKRVDDADVARLLWDPPASGWLRRTVHEAKLFEAGPVVFPAYQTATVDVRNKIKENDMWDRYATRQQKDTLLDVTLAGMRAAIDQGEQYGRDQQYDAALAEMRSSRATSHIYTPEQARRLRGGHRIGGHRSTTPPDTGWRYRGAPAYSLDPTTKALDTSQPRNDWHNPRRVD